MKRVLALILALVMSLALVACGEKQQADDQGAASSGDKVVKIGVFEPSTGDSASGGKKEILGMQFANAETPTVEVNGEKYSVVIGANNGTAPANTPNTAEKPATSVSAEGAKELTSPLEGKFYLVKSSGDVAVKVGDAVKKGQTVCYVEAMKTFNAIAAECDGVVAEICLTSGSSVAEDDVLMKIK